MPLALQAKVLRVVQERVVEPLGSNRGRSLDVRFIAATKLDLKAESDAGRFRADLYFRLATVELSIPPLRERREDIGLLHALFASAAAQRFAVEEPAADTHLIRALEAQDWPGNARELKAAAERFVLGIGRRQPTYEGAMQALPQRVARFEADAIAAALRDCKGSTTEAAAQLGLPRRTLNEKIARYGLRDHAV